MRLHFIANPAAGPLDPMPLLEAVTEGLRAEGLQLSLYVTSKPGDAGRHVADLGPHDVDRLIVVGGDGTLKEVVNGRPPPLPWPVGLLPMGTANLAGREMHMPLRSRPADVVRALLGAEPWPVDVLRIQRPDHTSDLAVSIVGAGLDAEIVRQVARVRARVDGAGGYAHWIRPIYECVRGFRFPRMRVTIDEQRTYAASACVVQNARSYGGLFELSPEAGLDTGTLDVAMIRVGTHRDLFRVMCGALVRRAHRFRDVKIVRGSTVRLRGDRPLPLQADGDPAGSTDVTITLLPKTLTLLRAGVA